MFRHLGEHAVQPDGPRRAQCGRRHHRAPRHRVVRRPHQTQAHDHQVHEAHVIATTILEKHNYI